MFEEIKATRFLNTDTNELVFGLQCKYSNTVNNKKNIQQSMQITRVIPKVSGLGILNNNIFYNLYIIEIYILYRL